jgi:hypothetical protein
VIFFLIFRPVHELTSHLSGLKPEEYIMFGLQIEKLSEKDIDQCVTLLGDVYTDEGYISPAIKYHWAMETLHQFLENKNRVLLVAKQGDRIVGMVSYHMDGTFPIEGMFPDELASLRNEHVPVVYIGSFVIDKAFRQGSVSLALLHTVQRELKRIENLNVICVVNEHHVEKYRGFSLLAKASAMEGMTDRAKASLLVRKQRAFAHFASKENLLAA